MTSEHQWANTYSRLVRWLEKHRPEVLKEYRNWLKKNGSAGSFARLAEVDLSKVTLASLTRPDEGWKEHDSDEYSPSDPKQGSHP